MLRGDHGAHSLLMGSGSPQWGRIAPRPLSRSILESLALGHGQVLSGLVEARSQGSWEKDGAWKSGAQGTAQLLKPPSAPICPQEKTAPGLQVALKMNRTHSSEGSVCSETQSCPEQLQTYTRDFPS